MRVATRWLVIVCSLGVFNAAVSACKSRHGKPSSVARSIPSSGGISTQVKQVIGEIMEASLSLHAENQIGTMTDAERRNQAKLRKTFEANTSSMAVFAMYLANDATLTPERRARFSEFSEKFSQLRREFDGIGDGESAQILRQIFMTRSKVEDLMDSMYGEIL